jgi:phage shock protein E
MSVTLVSPDELERMIQNDPTLVILDVREPKELATFGFIPNVINIDSKEILRRMNELPSDTTTEIVVVCQTGARSTVVCAQLVSAGYFNIYNLYSGMLGWMVRGKNLQRI